MTDKQCTKEKRTAYEALIDIKITEEAALTAATELVREVRAMEL